MSEASTVLTGAQGDTGKPAGSETAPATTTVVETKPAGETKTDGAGETKPKAEGEVKPAETKEGDPKKAAAPEKYEPFKLPEGMAVDAKLLERAEPVLKELGLDQVGAQKLVSMFADHVKAIDAEFHEAETKLTQDWDKTIKADPELGGGEHAEKMQLAYKAALRFGGNELVEVLKDPRYGNNIPLVRALYRAGLAIKEDSTVTAGSSAGTAAKPPEDVMYGGAKK